MTLTARIARKLKGRLLSRTLRRYRSLMYPDSPLRGIPMRIVGDASADPTETFDHYDAFAFWSTLKIDARPPGLAILDLGSKKLVNAVRSAQHAVTSLVLADCGDDISKVRYVLHDVSERLPFEDRSFDVFTSMASLPLIGLGRYGDRLNPNCLPNLVSELGRVVRNDGELLVSMCLGRNVLNFNNGWFLDIDTIRGVFAGWHITDYLVDNWSSPRGKHATESPRFNRDADVGASRVGDYRVIFLQLVRSPQPARP